jgi:hypothetical protein
MACKLEDEWTAFHQDGSGGVDEAGTGRGGQLTQAQTSNHAPLTARGVTSSMPAALDPRQVAAQGRV